MQVHLTIDYQTSVLQPVSGVDRTFKLMCYNTLLLLINSVIHSAWYQFGWHSRSHAIQYFLYH